jgi:alkanesulfonate monooxygenase SsuD/methylene tetrahydromethanopterin reductase-like flavin-dependent oxidoreductase (luciferase family)
MHTSDHVGNGPATLAPLVAIAQATTRLRVCPLVLNNDFHHPVHLARELATIGHLSGGRLEIGIGAGHSFNEYEAIGVPFDTPAIRKARMGEASEILRSLLEDDEVSSNPRAAPRGSQRKTSPFSCSAPRRHRRVDDARAYP